MRTLLTSSIVLFSTLRTSYAQYCQFCPQGSYVTAPKNPILNNDGTFLAYCGDFDQQITSTMENGTGICDSYTYEIDYFDLVNGVDLRLYCGCSDYENPSSGVCDRICGDDDLANPDAQVDDFYTCQAFEDFLNSVTDKYWCGSTMVGWDDDELAQNMKSTCCTSQSNEEAALPPDAQTFPPRSSSSMVPMKFSLVVTFLGYLAVKTGTF